MSLFMTLEGGRKRDMVYSVSSGLCVCMLRGAGRAGGRGRSRGAGIEAQGGGQRSRRCGSRLLARRGQRATAGRAWAALARPPAPPPRRAAHLKPASGLVSAMLVL
jgi:hypothetical protein